VVALVFAGLGLPAPELQAEIRDVGGRLVGWVDFLFREQRLIVEFEGRVKYDGADGRDALFREKRREDALRALGYQVVRLIWRDLHDPALVGRLITHAFSLQR
jgi:very-short-patch-repair endonuclease